MTFRTIRDDHGVEWEIWEVIPRNRLTQYGAVTAEISLGWLTLRSRAERRRVTPAPEGWQKMTDDEMLALLSSAERVPSGGE